MNKIEKAAVVILVILLVGWGFFQRKYMQPQPAPAMGGTNTTSIVSNALSQTTGDGAPGATVTTPDDPTIPDASASVLSAPVESSETEVLRTLVNDVVVITVSSHGATIKDIILKDFPATQDVDSAPVHLDFSSRPAFMISGIPGLAPADSYDLSVNDGGSTIVATTKTQSGLRHERTFLLQEDYRMQVTDAFSTLEPEGMLLPASFIALGPMEMIKSKSKTRGISYLGLDTMPDEAGQDVTHWGKKKLPAMFGGSSTRFSCARSDASNLPGSIEHSIAQPLAWAAAKNKFFVQILAPEGGAEDGVFFAERRTDARSLEIAKVAADLKFPGITLAGGETYRRSYSYYAGPKKQDLLKTLPNNQGAVMQFGWWGWFRWVCGLLLTTLNLIHSVLPNYGVAIIILTIIVKVLFWPLTHKGTESAKKMQQLQPKIAEIREKFKEQPQKLQKAQMAMYKENGVNPMASCLPMVVQLPIFIALFTVLRSAVELRFAGFLWITDLSEPEGLFAALLPIPLNILPLFMTITMVFQQRLTPSSGDPQQQKMMMIMPVVMLFIFYNMASALVLYWSISQSLSIVQLLLQRRKGKAAEA
jgi:YidC/Oxa1 family membrane protein insertase